MDATGIAWKSDVDSKFANVPPSNFNTAPDLRGGGTINGSLQVRACMWDSTFVGTLQLAGNHASSSYLHSLGRASLARSMASS